MNQEQLLAHAEFVRSLAKSLVVDEHSAADVEQRTWQAALEHPPASDRNLRSWFGRVIRNFVVTGYRVESRRKKYEESAPALNVQSTPEDIAMRKEALRSLTEAVLGLEEPYLSTILLRYYEDLPPRTVAQRLDIPVETVKTRIQRGLNQLRDRLDRSHGGDRMSWCLALAPLAGLKLASSAAAATASVSATVSAGSSGGSSAAAPGAFFGLKIGLAAALILGTTFVLHTVFQGLSSEDAATPPRDMVSEVEATEETDVLLLMNFPIEEGGTELPSLVLDRTGRTLLAPGGKKVSGKVKDSKTREPIQVFDFYMEMMENHRIVSVVHETVQDGDGRFSIPIGKGNYGFFKIWSNHYTRTREHWFKASEGSDLTGFEIELDRGLLAAGRVVDDATNRPVQGAVVGPAIYPTETDLVSLSLMGYEEGGIWDVTDADGRFSIRGLRRIDERIAAVHPDFAEGHDYTRPGSGADVEIRLKKGYQLYGKVRDDGGRPLEKVVIRLFGRGIPVCRPVLTGPGGEFRTPPVRPGRIFVKAGDPPMEMKGHPEFNPEFKVIDVIDGDMEVNFGLGEEHLTWHGTLYNHEGTPEARGCLLVRPAFCSRDEAYRYKFRRFIHCDDQGRFEVDKIVPGRYQIAVMLSGASRPGWFPWGIETFEAADRVERDIELHRGSTILGMVVDRVTGAPLTGKRGRVSAHRRGGESRPHSADLDKEGRFALKGLLPGSYEVHAYVEGCKDRTVVGVKVHEGCTLSDFRIPVSSKGRLRLNLVGFNENERNRVKPAFHGGISGSKFIYRDFRIGRDGTLVKDYGLEVGSWKVSLCFTKLGYIERHVDILDGRNTELTIHRNEITPLDGFITLSGEVASREGLPVEGLSMRFKADAVPNLSPNNRVLKGTTDAGGCFELAGFQPGRWWVFADFPGGGELTLPQLWIPPEAADPFYHRMVVQGGVVTGTLINRLTRLPIDTDQPCGWILKLQDVNKNCTIYNLDGERSGYQFQIKGLSPRKYQLLIDADGYEDYLSGSFTLEEGQTLNLDEIWLEPCGILNLEVLDENLQPLNSFWVLCDGKRRLARDHLEGRNQYNKLPVGPVTITIGARGYLEKSMKITLDPGHPVEARVILRSKP